jgi:hypothetical protein
MSIRRMVTDVVTGDLEICSLGVPDLNSYDVGQVAWLPNEARMQFDGEMPEGVVQGEPLHAGL